MTLGKGALPHPGINAATPIPCACGRPEVFTLIKREEVLFVCFSCGTTWKGDLLGRQVQVQVRHIPTAREWAEIEEMREWWRVVRAGQEAQKRAEGEPG